MSELMSGENFNKTDLQYFYTELKPGFTHLKDVYLEELQKRGFVVVAMGNLKRSIKFNREFYCDLLDRLDRDTGKPVFPYVNSYMCGNENRVDTGKPALGPSVSYLVYGNVSDAREFQGKTFGPAEGTFRHKFGIGHITQNVNHCSDTDTDAKTKLPNALKEVGLVFFVANKFEAEFTNFKILEDSYADKQNKINRKSMFEEIKSDVLNAFDGIDF